MGKPAKTPELTLIHRFFGTGEDHSMENVHTSVWEVEKVLSSNDEESHKGELGAECDS
jgi:hypothetical protein